LSPTPLSKPNTNSRSALVPPRVLLLPTCPLPARPTADSLLRTTTSQRKVLLLRDCNRPLDVGFRRLTRYPIRKSLAKSTSGGSDFTSFLLLNLAICMNAIMSGCTGMSTITERQTLYRKIQASIIAYSNMAGLKLCSTTKGEGGRGAGGGGSYES